MAENDSPVKLAFQNNSARQQIEIIKEENKILLEENQQLQRNLENTLTQQTNLYRDWKHLQAIKIARDAESEKHLKTPPGTASRTLFLFILILTSLLAIFTFYNVLRKAAKNTSLHKQASIVIKR